MKRFSLLPVLLIFLSCQKQIDAPVITSDAKKTFTVSDITQPYSDRMWNTCLNEWVDLSGEINYYIKQNLDENGFYLDYIIDLKHAEGISESGIKFHGGGKYSGRVRQTFISEEVTDERGHISYNIKYESPSGQHMGYLQHAKFIMKNNDVKVEFNNEVPTCE